MRAPRVHRHHHRAYAYAPPVHRCQDACLTIGGCWHQAEAKDYKLKRLLHHVHQICRLHAQAPRRWSVCGICITWSKSCSYALRVQSWCKKRCPRAECARLGPPPDRVCAMRQLPDGVRTHQANSPTLCIGRLHRKRSTPYRSPSDCKTVTSLSCPNDQTVGSQRHGCGCTWTPQTRTDLLHVVNISDGEVLDLSTKASASASVAMYLCLPDQFNVPTRGLSHC